MRITCEQYYGDINSQFCKEYCDLEKRWEQFNRVQKEIENDVPNTKN